MTEPRTKASFAAAPAADEPAHDLLKQYFEVRRATEMICAPLSSEDYVIQPFLEASPPKWHLAHTTWFFETFVLSRFIPDYGAFHPHFHYLFNSYYHSAGAMLPRERRGMLSRPTVEEIFRYRKHIDNDLAELILNETVFTPEVAYCIMLGLHHEEQHQELLVTDIKAIFWANPLRPAYLPSATEPAPQALRRPEGDRDVFAPSLFHASGIREIGHSANEKAFAFDNEMPRHRVYLDQFALTSIPVTNAEYLDFIAAKGYSNPALWLSDGWAMVCQKQWVAPLYWEKSSSDWLIFTLNGMRKLEGSLLQEPIAHLSYFEASAYAKFRGLRLPTEAEWEVATTDPREQAPPMQIGSVWEWTASSYAPYPGFREFPAPFGEYNGKFMCNQYVLRGGSMASPKGHVRATYRNYFPPDARWQFSGARLAK